MTARESPEQGGCVAIDIECINLVEPPDLDFQNPTHWGLFCIPIGYRSPSGDVEVDVLFRDSMTPCSELELLNDTISWVRERRPGTIVTYNGESYDLPILRERARVSSHECPGDNTANENLSLMLSTTAHVDLFPIVEEAAGHMVSLDDALEYHEIDADLSELNGEEVDGSDMPALGKRHMRGGLTNQELEAVRAYAAADVQPLFELYDILVDGETVGESDAGSDTTNDTGETTEGNRQDSWQAERVC